MKSPRNLSAVSFEYSNLGTQNVPGTWEACVGTRRKCTKRAKTGMNFIINSSCVVVDLKVGVLRTELYKNR